ncbi:DUF4145 domain-containing protein [Providencia sp. wls1922]|uniref:DUF4145 domain-containing protein n=1 Tax=Providencia sp. wls1922 TaxID=2675152 RepID=UPI0012B5CD87|nr:DUF4145 domain-containing protein [Providencia sp. wls1922]MTC44440.1 DUF4145 domain-containing protein [Providencia sp. wls1922]
MGKITGSFSENKFKGEKVREVCGRCHRETNHEVVVSYEKNGEENYGGGDIINWYGSFQVIQCKGCDDLSFREEHFFSEDVHQIFEDEWDDGTRITLYPKRTEYTRTTKDLMNVPLKLRNIYVESIEAFNNDSFILTAVGLRALVEGICSFLKISGGLILSSTGDEIFKKNLEGKIFGLSQKGHLTEAGAKFLHEHRFMGNAAVHSLERPSRQDLSIAIELLEHALDAIFELPAKAEELEESRKRRNRHPPVKMN